MVTVEELKKAKKVKATYEGIEYILVKVKGVCCAGLEPGCESSDGKDDLKKVDVWVNEDEVDVQYSAHVDCSTCFHYQYDQGAGIEIIE